MGLLGRVLGVVAAGVLMLVVSIVGGVYLWAHESIAAVSAHSPDVKAAQTTLDGVPPADKAAIALVIGYDRRHGEAEGTPSRSDTLMLLRADPQTDSISMLSFPRDLIVEIRCPGSVFRRRSTPRTRRAAPRVRSTPSATSPACRSTTSSPSTSAASSALSTGWAASGSTSTAATSTTTRASARALATRRSTSGPATSG